MKNIFFTMFMLLLVIIVYFNLGSISSSIKKYLVTDKEPTIYESNSYTRDYDYIAFNYETDYKPLTKNDIMNIYFNVLNNGWETFTFYCPSEYTSCISDVKEIRKDDTLISNISNYVHPYNSFSSIDTKVSKNGEITIYVKKKYSDKKILELNKKVNKIIKELKIKDLTDKEKIEKIHNYIINNTLYDNDEINNKSKYDSKSAYGVLIEGYGVCYGYSDAMALFLDIFDIPNLKLSSEKHIWNLVYIDGKWLHLDLTWDDIENDKYKLNYFLITKEKLFTLDSKKHLYDEDFFLEAF